MEGPGSVAAMVELGLGWHASCFTWGSMDTRRVENPHDFLQIPSPSLVGTQLGNCRIERYLAHGGMGDIYVARQTHLRRDVAVKVPRMTGQQSRLHRQCLEAEARYLARIQHVNVVQVFDMGLASPSLPYLVLELLSGRALDAVLARSPRLSVQSAVRIAREAARGLAACHRAGIVCVDVKPENIMVVDGPLVGGARRGGVWVKVIDLGAALPVDADGRVAPRNRVVGTPEYTAPEIVRGEPFDERADVYALGTLLFELLTGWAPFRLGRASAVLEAQISRPAPTLGAQLDEVAVGDPLDRLVEACLRKDPARRPGSMLEFLERLDTVSPTSHVGARLASDPTASTPTRRLSQIATIRQDAKPSSLGRGDRSQPDRDA